MSENLNQKILDKIKADKIAPKPRWQFLLKDYTVWILGVLALLVGAAATSVIMYLLAYNDWRLYEEMSDSFLSFLILSMPYFWLVFFALFIGAAYYNVKHTKQGYKYSLPLIIIVTVSLSLLGGGFLFAAGAGQAIDDALGKAVPVYHKFINPLADRWHRPTAGYLAGLVIEKADANNFTVVDIHRQEWRVICQDPCHHDLLVVGRPAKMMGEIENNVFIAEQVMGMGPGRGQFMRPHFRDRLPAPCPNCPRPGLMRP